MVELKFRDVGEGIEEGVIVRWYVKKGDTVTEDQKVIDIETDKAVVSLPAPVSGVITEQYGRAGDKIKVRLTLVINEENGGKRSVGVVGELEEAPPEAVAKEGVKFYFKDGREAKTLQELKKIIEESSEEDFLHHVNQEKNDVAVWIRHALGREDLAGRVEKITDKKMMVQTLQEKAADARVLTLPKVKKWAKERGIHLKDIKGTGPGGRVTVKDLGDTTGIHITKKYDMWGYVEHIPLQGVRKIIAERMVQSWITVPQVTYCDEADVTRLEVLRKKGKEPLTLLPFVIKACVAALQQFPFMNASMGKEEIIVKKYYNIGIAVETDAGLLVPVIKGVTGKKREAIAAEIKILAEKARNRTIDRMDLTGGTFTLTNIGSIGGLFFTPILNLPEVAILGMGRVKEEYTKEGKMKKMLPLSLTFDHRVLDGAYAARFVNQLKKNLESFHEDH